MHMFDVSMLHTYVANRYNIVVELGVFFTSDGTISGECVSCITSYWHHSTVVDWECLRGVEVVDAW